mmetsp:Transcript_23303/g.60740  ORF Transcript_23303/g.60740 Transcript_23303/m.60740 type:complete len:202 (-) Transcript_23303:762-1367(-)
MTRRAPSSSGGTTVGGNDTRNRMYLFGSGSFASYLNGLSSSYSGNGLTSTDVERPVTGVTNQPCLSLLAGGGSPKTSTWTLPPNGNMSLPARREPSSPSGRSMEALLWSSVPSEFLRVGPTCAPPKTMARTHNRCVPSAFGRSTCTSTPSPNDNCLKGPRCMVCFKLAQMAILVACAEPVTSSVLQASISRLSGSCSFTNL